MKKFLIAIILLCIIVAGAPKNNFSLTDFFCGEYYACTSLNVKNGVGAKITQNYVLDYSLLKAEMIVVKNLEISAALKQLNAKVVDVEYANNKVLIYAFSNLIKTSVKKGGKKFNLQFLNLNDSTLIAWPQIFEVENYN